MRPAPVTIIRTTAMHGYKINKHLNLVVFKYRGEATIQQMAGNLKAVFHDPDFSPEMNSFTDAVELTSIFSYDDLAEMLKLFPSPPDVPGPKPRGAILVGKDLFYGIGRMFGSITDGKLRADVRIFRTMEETLDWLRLPADAEIEYPF
jgi:hypothetical protein